MDRQAQQDGRRSRASRDAARDAHGLPERLACQQRAIDWAPRTLDIADPRQAANWLDGTRPPVPWAIINAGALVAGVAGCGLR